jgi:hypothetical protein
MADPVPNLEGNTGTQGAPTWTSVMAGELRWCDTRQTNIASASWPQTVRPGANTQVGFLHAYTADAVGDAIAGVTFGLATYNQCRWNFAAGTFASAPTLTAYPSVAHGAPVAGDGSILGGHATDTGSYSYIKGDAYGFYGQAPAAAPTGAFPTAADGTAGSVATATGAWQNAAAKWQSMQGDITYITCGAAPGAGPLQWYFMLALFMGPNMTPGLMQPVISTKYTWT